MEILKITHTGKEIDSGKIFAYFDRGQFEISLQAKLNIDWAIKTQGGYSVDRNWFDTFPGIKYEW
jgi:hypothetical protein